VIKLIEGRGYRVAKNLRWPEYSERNLEGWAFTNLASPTVAVVLLVARVLGKPCYYLPDGILELNNLSRKENWFARLVIGLSDGVLVADRFSACVAEAAGWRYVYVGSKPKIANTLKHREIRRALLVTARTPYFCAQEKDQLCKAITSFRSHFPDFFPGTLLKLRSTQEIAALTGGGWIHDLSPSLENALNDYDLVISCTSTVLIECAYREIPLIHLCFRPYEITATSLPISSKEFFASDKRQFLLEPNDHWVPLVFGDASVSQVFALEYRLKLFLKAFRDVFR